MQYSKRNGNIVNMYLYTLEMALCKIYMAWRMWLYSQRMLKMGFIIWIIQSLYMYKVHLDGRSFKKNIKQIFFKHVKGALTLIDIKQGRFAIGRINCLPRYI